MKKIITIIAIVFMSTLAFCQPTPGEHPESPETGGTKRDPSTTPVGSATALLLSLGAGAVAYKVKKSKKIDACE